MNILFTSDTYHTAINGIVTHIATLKAELEKRGHTVVIVAPKYSNHQEEPNVYRLPSFSFPARPEDSIGNFMDKKTKELLMALDFDLVHNHTFLTGYLGTKIAKKKQIPNIATYHTPFDQYVHRIIPGAEKPFKKPLDLLARSFFNKFDLILSPSPKSTIHLEEIKTKTKNLHLPNGIDLKVFKNAKKEPFLQKFKIDPKRPIITIVGRLDQGKNVELAIEAMAQVKAKMPEALLAIVGDGTTRKKCEKLVKKLNLEKNVIITGFLDQKLVASAHQAANLSLMLSKVDNLPTVAIEAAAAKTPLITLDDPGMKLIVSHRQNGLLVNPTKEEVTDAILFMLKDQKLLQKYGQKSAQIAEKFSIEKYVDKLEPLYTQLISSHKQL